LRCVVDIDFISYIYILQITLTNEITEKDYTITQQVWLQMDTYTDFWREIPIPQADGTTPGQLYMSSYRCT